MESLSSYLIPSLHEQVESLPVRTAVYQHACIGLSKPLLKAGLVILHPIGTVEAKAVCEKLHRFVQYAARPVIDHDVLLRFGLSRIVVVFVLWAMRESNLLVGRLVMPVVDAQIVELTQSTRHS